MPELIEVEQYRHALDALVGAQIKEIQLAHVSYLRPSGTPTDVLDVLTGGTLLATRRRGKLLLADVGCRVAGGDRVTLGLRFGMTGMLLIDGRGPIEQLEYASPRNDPSWDRVQLYVGDSVVSVRDQRRLGSIELDPDEAALGPDAANVTAGQLAEALDGRRRAVKAVLLDQALVAGVGNLLADEALWRSSLKPTRPAGDLEPSEVVALAAAVRETIRVLSARGGSHRGDTFEHRVAGSTCPRCGGAMRHSTVGGRSTWWCSAHQR